jgi:hypothetical protein
MSNTEKPKSKWSFKKLSKIQLVGIILVVCLATALCSYVGASVISSLNSTTTVPPGNPTPSPTPAPTQTPLTDTFTLTATLNGAPVSDPTNIVIPSGAYIGTVYTEVFTFTSTANQPIIVTASCPNGQTGNMAVVWDAITQANGYLVSLPSYGSTATMTMTVTLGSVGGTIPLVFTPTP